ncbi:MAG: hypothetical protein SXU28_13375 [Pseudomonadota bacterium]|nr:hypothetical protein [Pseudomonadota bacterium]
MTQILELDGGNWLDEHRTCDRTALSVLKVRAQPTGDLATDLAERSQTIGAMMDRLAGQEQPVAITGSAWSQSDLFPSPAIRIDSGEDRALWEVPESALVPEVSDESARFVFATGGSKLSEIMEFLDAHGMSFRTAGSHKGQSIAGAIATGTHGSIIGETGLESHIRGLLFVNGSGAAHWIADPERPVLKPGFTEGFAHNIHPASFTDALIHLGGLGYCAGVLLEGVPRFGLSWAKRVAPLPESWWSHIAVADYDAAGAGLSDGQPLAFYELTFDPNAPLDGEVMQTVYWRDELADTAAMHSPQTQPAPRDALDMLADGLNSISEQMVSARRDPPHDPETETPDQDRPGFLNLGFVGLGGIRLVDIPEMIFDDFRKSAEKEPRSSEPSSLLQLTGEWEPRSVFGIRIDTFNAAICVPVGHLQSALEIGAGIAPKFRKHFVYTVRFAKGSRASLSFLRFEDCAIINIDGLTRAGIAGWISHSDEAAEAFTDALAMAGIPFSMHWGKDIPSSADKIARDFGPAVTRYQDLRAQMVPPPLRAVLTSPMLDYWGLS